MTSSRALTQSESRALQFKVLLLRIPVPINNFQRRRSASGSLLWWSLVVEGVPTYPAKMYSRILAALGFVAALVALASAQSPPETTARKLLLSGLPFAIDTCFQPVCLADQLFIRDMTVVDIDT